MAVYCQMANTAIPENICETEQDSAECRGCRAASRRCTQCGKARGIAEPKKGLCAKCHCNASEETGQARVHPAQALEEVVALFRSVAAATTHTVEQPRRYQAKSGSMQASPHLAHPDALFAALCEHAVQHGNGEWRVHEPARLLQIRFKLTPEEAERALAQLVKRDLIARHEMWITIRQMPASARGAGMEDVNETEGVPLPVITARPARYTPPPADPVPMQPRVAALQAPARPKPRTKTFREVYADLLGRASSVSGERLVRGAIPILQLQAKLGPPDAIRVLDRLEADGHIAKRGGWGTIALLSDSVDSIEPVVAEPIVASPATKPVSGRGGFRASGVRMPSGAPKPIRPNAAPIVPDIGTFDTAIAELEQRLPKLRELRDEMCRRVATLEASLVALQASREQYVEADAATNRLLQETEVATAQLLAALRKGGGS